MCKLPEQLWKKKFARTSKDMNIKLSDSASRYTKYMDIFTLQNVLESVWHMDVYYTTLLQTVLLVKI